MPRLEVFVEDIARSRLIASADLDRVLADLPRAPEADAAVRLARALIGAAKLTPYQARKLLNGATRGFFLGDYRILRPLGEGGMGKVYLAVKEGTTQRVAVKVLPPKKAAGEVQALARFRREIELSQRVVHPNLARTLGFGEESGAHFLVLEYIPGESIYQAIKSPRGGPLRVTDAARLFLKVLDGLEAAHAAGLVHRDIKPSNIMITPDGDAKLLDLGLARSTGDEAPLTRPNLVVGTLDYVSPEQLVNASTADGRSDLYSLGCTLYFTLAGHPPFEGGDMVNKIFKQRMEDPEPLERVARGVPAAFAAIVKKLMAKEPAHRYQTAAELRADLVRWTSVEKLRDLLGTEAESARAFRPPTPELDDDDLRLLADDPSGGPGASLRDLGDAEPGAAPYHRNPSPAVKAVVVPPTGRPNPHARGADDSSFLIPFIIVTVVLGVVAVILITLLS